jgi:hypothetical protein
LYEKRFQNLKGRKTMAEDRPKPNQGNNPSSELPPPKPEIIDIGPRIIQEEEVPGGFTEIIQEIETK